MDWQNLYWIGSLIGTAALVATFLAMLWSAKKTRDLVRIYEKDYYPNVLIKEVGINTEYDRVIDPEAGLFGARLGGVVYKRDRKTSPVVVKTKKRVLFFSGPNIIIIPVELVNISKGISRFNLNCRTYFTADNDYIKEMENLSIAPGCEYRDIVLLLPGEAKRLSIEVDVRDLVSDLKDRLKGNNGFEEVKSHGIENLNAYVLSEGLNNGRLYIEFNIVYKISKKIELPNYLEKYVSARIGVWDTFEGETYITGSWVFAGRSEIPNHP